jgi:hypothetical protein
VPLAFDASGGASGSRMDREVQERLLSVLGWGGASSSRHRSGQVLADLAPGAKVVQTVVCSTFTPGAKPRYPEGGRRREDEPPRRGGAFAQIKETSSTRAMSAWRTV